MVSRPEISNGIPRPILGHIRERVLGHGELKHGAIQVNKAGKPIRHPTIGEESRKEKWVH